MKNIINILFATLIVFSFTSCDDEYDVSEIPADNVATVIRATIDSRYVNWKNQRSFYDHENKVITIRMIEDSFEGSNDASALIVYVSPVMWATMSPYGGVEEDWSSGQKQYTITSGDGSVSNVYTIIIEEVASF